MQYSPNMLKTFEICPKKFYFRYEENISMPVNDDIFEFGKNIHALASYYLKGFNIDKMENSLTPQESSVWNYLKQSKYFGYEVINTEYSLCVKINNHYYGGRIDALVKNDDMYYILDYKTGSIPKNPKYDFQTIIYLLCVKEYFKTQKVTFVYLDLKNKTEAQIQYSSDLEREYIKKLEEITLKIINHQNYKKKENCNCEYSKICW